MPGRSCRWGADRAEPPATPNQIAWLESGLVALAPSQVVTWDLPAEPEIVAEARARARRQVTAWGLEEVTFTTELLVSELVTNAIRHASRRSSFG
jgi:hypothetical protein